MYTKLILFLLENEIEFQDTEAGACVFISVSQIGEFMEILKDFPFLLDEGGVNCVLLRDYFSFELSEILTYLNPSKIRDLLS